MIIVYYILTNALIFIRLIKNCSFDKNGYSLEEETNQNSKIIVLINQYLASL